MPGAEAASNPEGEQIACSLRRAETRSVPTAERCAATPLAGVLAFLRRMTKPAQHVRVPVFYDFSSTICYLTHRVLGRLGPQLDEIGVELEWHPIDLVAITAWKRGEPFGPERTRTLERLARDLGVRVATPEHWMDSRPAMAVAAGLDASPDDADRWREAVWSWVYQDARTLEEPDALDAIAARAAVQVTPPTPSLLEEIERRTAAAHAAGVRGVPTFLLDVWPVGIGIQEEETMLDFLRRFAAKKRGELGPN